MVDGSVNKFATFEQLSEEKHLSKIHNYAFV